MKVHFGLKTYIYPAEFTACDNYTMTACFKSYEQGGVLPQVVTVNNGNTAIVINSITLRNCNGTGVAGPFSGASHQITLADLTALNINPTDPQHYMSQNECICVDVDFDINCVTDANLQLPFITLDCQTYCGNPYSASAPFPASNLSTSHPSLCTGCFTINKTANPTDVVDGVETVNYEITICANNDPLNPATNYLVTLWDDYPVGYAPSLDPFNGGGQANAVQYTFPQQAGIQCTTYIANGIPNGDPCNTAWIDIDNSGSGDLSSQACVNFLPNCRQLYPNAFVIADGDDWQTLANNVGFPNNNQEFIVQGNFTVNDWAYIASKQIYFEPGAQISVDANQYLEIKNCDLKACSKMYRGIRLGFDPNQQIGSTLYMPYSQVNDAQYAVFAPDYTRVFLVNTTFENNFEGLHVPLLPPNSQTGLPNSNSVMIYGCTFRGTGTMALNYQGQTPQTGNIVGSSFPYAGIEVNRMMLDLNQWPGVTNSFLNMSNGIIARRSNLRMTDCYFQDIQPDAAYTNLAALGNLGNFNGSGVYASGHRTNFAVDQTGYGNQGAPSFVNCNYGIFAHSINFYSTQNNMMGVNTAYRALSCKGTTQLTWNNLDTWKNSIELQNCDGSQSTVVWNNDILFGNNELNKDYAGILVNENRIPNHNSHIHNNRVNFRPGATTARVGIKLNAAHTFFTTENIITMADNTVNHDGILLAGCERSMTDCNHVTGMGSIADPDNTQSAITNDMGTAPTISCNDVNQTLNGITFLGITVNSTIQNTNLRGNNFYTHLYGLRYSIGARTNGQVRRGNIWWELAQSGTQALHDNGGIVNFFFNTVNPLNPPVSGTYPNATFFPTHSPINWFQPDFSNSNWDCSRNGPGGGAYCGYYVPDLCPGCLDPADAAIAAGTIDNDPYTDETLWMLRKELFAKLDENPQLLTDPVYSNFFNSLQGSAISQIKEVDDQKMLLYAQDATLNALLAQKKTDWDLKLAALSLKMSQIKTALAANASITTLLGDVAQLQVDNTTIITTAESAVVAAEPMHEGVVDDADFDNAMIPATDLIENNEKTVNEIYLATLARGSEQFTEAQITTLSDIAHQCPMAGGDAVFRARSMFALVSDELFYDDRILCNIQGVAIRKPAPLTETGTKMQLIPNPATDKVTISYYLPDDENYNFALYTLTGQLVKNFSISGGISSYTFGTRELLPAVYQYKLSNATHAVENGKLIIIR